MSDPRNGNGNGLGGFGGGALGDARLPGMGDEPSDSIDVPGVGRIDRGETPLHSIHNYNRAVYQKLQTADRLVGHMRGEMDKLAILGDTVTPEDVIAAAGRLVGHGVPARELAGILADMPSQAGQGLAAWIARNDALLVQQEAHITQVRAIAQHQMGVSAIRAMAAGDVTNARRQAASQPATPMGMAATEQPRALGAQPQGGVPEPQMLQMVGQGAQSQGQGEGSS